MSAGVVLYVQVRMFDWLAVMHQLWGRTTDRLVYSSGTNRSRTRFLSSSVLLGFMSAVLSTTMPYRAIRGLKYPLNTNCDRYDGQHAHEQQSSGQCRSAPTAPHESPSGTGPGFDVSIRSSGVLCVLLHLYQICQRFVKNTWAVSCLAIPTMVGLPLTAR